MSLGLALKKLGEKKEAGLGYKLEGALKAAKEAAEKEVYEEVANYLAKTGEGWCLYDGKVYTKRDCEEYLK